MKSEEYYYITKYIMIHLAYRRFSTRKL